MPDRVHAGHIPGSHTGILHSENWSLTTSNMGREFNLYIKLQIIWQIKLHIMDRKNYIFITINVLSHDFPVTLQRLCTKQAQL